MSLAKICDVCGKLHEHYGQEDTADGRIIRTTNAIRLGYNTIDHVNSFKPLDTFDLCTECRDSILAHIASLRSPVVVIEENKESED